MAQEVKYIIDNSGKKTSVIVPYRKWEQLNEKYEKLKNKLDVLKAIKDGIAEVKDARKKRKEIKTLSKFLDEC